MGVRLFEIQGRKAELTEIGRLLPADAESRLAGFHELEQRACLMASGGASQVRHSVDSIFPDDRIFAAFAAFSRQFPHVKPAVRLIRLDAFKVRSTANTAEVRGSKRIGLARELTKLIPAVF